MSTPPIPPSKAASTESSSVDEEKKEHRPNQVEQLPFGLDAADDDGPLTGAVALPWTKKLPALVLILLFVFGSNFADSAFSPLKSTIKKEISVNNAQYGVLASADSLINSVLPIVTGILIDYYGPTSGASVASVFILVGQTLTAVGTQVTSFLLMVVDQIILGFGATAIETCEDSGRHVEL